MDPQEAHAGQHMAMYNTDALKRPAPSTQCRREKNRISAKKFRTRKKQYMNTLESMNKQLVQEHKALKKELAQTEGLLTALVSERSALAREHDGLQTLLQKLAMVGSAQAGIPPPSNGLMAPAIGNSERISAPPATTDPMGARMPAVMSEPDSQVQVAAPVAPPVVAPVAIPVVAPVARPIDPASVDAQLMNETLTNPGVDPSDNHHQVAAVHHRDPSDDHHHHHHQMPHQVAAAHHQMTTVVATPVH